MDEINKNGGGAGLSIASMILGSFNTIFLLLLLHSVSLRIVRPYICGGSLEKSECRKGYGCCGISSLYYFTCTCSRYNYYGRSYSGIIGTYVM